MTCDDNDRDIEVSKDQTLNFIETAEMIERRKGREVEREGGREGGRKSREREGAPCSIDQCNNYTLSLDSNNRDE